MEEMNIKNKKIGLFLALTFILSWSIVIVFRLLGGSWNSIKAVLIATAYMFMPMVSAILVQKVIYGESLREPLGITFNINRWFLIAWLLPPIIAIATFGISLLFPGVTYSPEMAGIFPPEQLEQIETQIGELPLHPFWLALFAGLFAGITLNAVAGFGEELGWRGFLVKELNFMKFWKLSASIGIIWGVWHTPLILLGHNYPQHPIVGVFMMIMYTLLLTPIITYVRLKAKSVIAAAIMHGTVNGTGGLSVIIIAGGNDLLIGITGIAGFIILLLVNLTIFSLEKPLWETPVEKFLDT